VPKSPWNLSAVVESSASAFNPSRLTLARKRRGLTKTGLATRLGVIPRAVIGFEAGEYAPADDTLTDMQNVLGFPAEFFLGDDIDEPEVFAVSFRSLTKMTAMHRDMALSQGALAIHLTRWLEERFVLPESALPDLSQEADPEAAAESLRQMWGLGQLPISNMIHLLESKGVRVFSIAVEAREVDAFSTWKGQSPFVFLNSFKSTEHGRFDAAHELGHLIMHKHGGPQGKRAELEANAFASAFLMPKGSVLGHAPRFVTLPQLVKIKKIWITSVAAVNHRLHELKLVSDWHYRGLCIELAKAGYRLKEPEEAPRETSLLLPKLLADLYQQDGLSRPRISQELGIPPSELENLLFSLVMTGIVGGRVSDKKPGNPILLSRVK
jgi:Zn-dependent peptidase ImmA (M78 family)/DNA-binding XRE family transcriptional regulator